MSEPDSSPGPDKPRKNANLWAKRILALAAAVLLPASSIPSSFASAVFMSSSTALRSGMEQLTGGSIDDNTIVVHNSGSGTAIVTAYGKRWNGDLNYHDVPDVTLIPGESTEISVDNLGNGIGVYSRRGYIYPVLYPVPTETDSTADFPCSPSQPTDLDTASFTGEASEGAELIQARECDLDGDMASEKTGESVDCTSPDDGSSTGEASLSGADTASPTSSAPSVDSGTEITVELTAVVIVTAIAIALVCLWRTGPSSGGGI